MTVDLLCGDVLTTEPGGLFHAMLCDPPYELGFMGRAWDKSGIAFDPATWARLGEHLYPGAFGMAFASSRGWHRMACAIEDAGFIIHPTVFCWAFGSGFPKATRIDTQVDKAAGAEREVIGEYEVTQDISGGSWEDLHGKPNAARMLDITAPATPLAATWAGHRYGLQALKPAVEPIIVFQKPYAGKPVDCITRTGAGALWVDGGRIGADTERGNRYNGKPSLGGGNSIYQGHNTEVWDVPAGRWPANFILGDDDAAAALDRQSGVSTSRESGYNWQDSGNENPTHVIRNIKSGVHHGDTGGASRFFYRVATALDEAEPVRYVAKSSRRERDAGLDSYLTVKYNIAILDLGGVPCQSVAMATAALLQRVMSESTRSLSIAACGESIMARCQKGGLSTTLTAIRKTIESRILPLLTLSLTSESTADASSLTASGGSHAESVESLRRWILTTIGGGMELARGVSLAASEMLLTISESGAWQEWKSSHPTHKPLDLCRYLATLLLPPAEYAPRRILIPFAGVGSECIGAALAGWDEVVGIEREAEYVEIGRARIAHWCAQPALLEVSA